MRKFEVEFNHVGPLCIEYILWAADGSGDQIAKIRLSADDNPTYFKLVKGVADIVAGMVD